jgi:DMSO/TMAO reductase YedYZ molybdopterin-dependent catalytic subunit
MTYVITLLGTIVMPYSRSSIILTVFIILLIAGAALLGSWVWTKLATGQTNTLNAVEIRDYKGEKLGSINDFRENSINGPQYVNISTYKLAVTGLVQNEKTYTYNDVIDRHTHYEKVVTINCVEGWSVKILWEGVLLKDLLTEAGYDTGALVVIFYAQDGYSTSLLLSYIVSNNIMIAYKMNGVVLPPDRGYPFQLVAESKYGYKWIKWITQIEVSDDANYRGYWESRGYSNNADFP